MAQVIAAPFLSAAVFVGGLATAAFWLWFWLREDTHPEPRRVLFLTFVVGTLAVPLALVFEEFIYSGGADVGLWNLGKPTFLLLFLWAGVEEVFKFGAAWWVALRRPFFDEPVDAPIYLITAALGFAAMENAFMFFNVFGSELANGFVTANLRFMGATLLHILTAAIVGFSVSYAFFHPERRWRNIIVGLALSTTLHAFFNFFILKGGGTNLLTVFSVVWVGAVVVILSFEKIKRISY